MPNPLNLKSLSLEDLTDFDIFVFCFRNNFARCFGIEKLVNAASEVQTIKDSNLTKSVLCALVHVLNREERFLASNFRSWLDQSWMIVFVQGKVF